MPEDFILTIIIGIIVIILFMAQIITMIIMAIHITIETITGDNYVALRKLGWRILQWSFIFWFRARFWGMDFPLIILGSDHLWSHMDHSAINSQEPSFKKWKRFGYFEKKVCFRRNKWAGIFRDEICSFDQIKKLSSLFGKDGNLIAVLAVGVSYCIALIRLIFAGYLSSFLGRTVNDVIRRLMGVLSNWRSKLWGCLKNS